MESYFQEMQETLTNFRRDLHRIPEPGLREVETAAYIQETLKSFGVKQLETWLETGVVAVFGERGKKDTVAFRADMDGLPVAEPPKCYASQHAGWMYASGGLSGSPNCIDFSAGRGRPWWGKAIGGGRTAEEI